MPASPDVATPPAPALIPAWVDGVLVPVDKLEVHRRGLRHPAISVFVLSRGQLLLQQRAASKYHTPGLWANACCTHPHWDEPAEHCARRRLAEELGLQDLPLRPAGRIEYRADVGGGLTEHEMVEVFLSETSTPPVSRPDPSEVQDTRWVTPETLRREIAARPEIFTPWLRIYMEDDRLSGGLFGRATG